MVSVDLSFSFSAPSPFLYFLPSLTCPGPSCSCYKSKKGRSVGSILGSSVAFFASAFGELGSRGGWAAGRLLLRGKSSCRCMGSRRKRSWGTLCLGVLQTLVTPQQGWDWPKK